VGLNEHIIAESEIDRKPSPLGLDERLALLSIVIVESGSGSTLNAGQMSRLTP
jgi:hypothetical protein